MMKTKRLVIYSENMHDYYLLSILKLYSELDIYNEIIILTFKEKIKRINDELTELVNQKKVAFKYNYFKSYKLKKVSRFMDSPVRFLFNVPVRLVNFIILAFFGLKYFNKNDFVITELQDSKNSYLIDLILKDNPKSNIKNFITLHNIDRFIIKDSKLNKLSKKFNYHIVLSNNLKENLKKYSNKKILIAPAALPTKRIVELRAKKMDLLKTKKVKFTVTGSIDDKRKDYKKIIDYFSKIENTLYELVLLGQVKSKWVVEYAHEKNVNIRFFNSFVADDVFEDEVLTSHFLLSFINNDRYFKVKISGSMYDSLRYAIPLISNNQTFNSENIQNIIVKSSDALLKIIAEIKNDNYSKKYGVKSLKLSKNLIMSNYLNNFKKEVF